MGRVAKFVAEAVFLGRLSAEKKICALGGATRRQLKALKESWKRGGMSLFATSETVPHVEPLLGPNGS